MSAPFPAPAIDQACPAPASPETVAVVWDAYGPQHVDRANALVPAFRHVLGIGLHAASDEYDWSWAPPPLYEPITLHARRRAGLGAIVETTRRLIGLRRRRGAGVWFLCNYERPAIAAAALALRASGARVFIMQDSTFDDAPRSLPRELLKAALYSPYHGAISASPRTTAYLRFLGVKGPIAEGYDTASTQRLRALAPEAEIPFTERNFLWVGRFIPKKNILMLIEAYGAYAAAAGPAARGLTLMGEGPLEGEIRAAAAGLGGAARVEILPWRPQPEVIARMAAGLYLLLPSLVEQFGNVVGEAASVGLPALVSNRAGSAGVITADFVSGFTLDPDNPAAWTAAMTLCAADEALWRRLRQGAQAQSAKFDACRFRNAALALAHPGGHARDLTT